MQPGWSRDSAETDCTMARRYPRPMRVGQRVVAAAVALGLALALAGCSYVNRVAARLNPDGSLDFATCDARNTDAFKVLWWYQTSERPVDYESRHPSVTDVVGDVEEGDVFHLDATDPGGSWVWVQIYSARNDRGLSMSGSFDADDLKSGNWVWNQTAMIFGGAVDVEHCELDEQHAR